MDLRSGFQGIKPTNSGVISQSIVLGSSVLGRISIYQIDLLGSTLSKKDISKHDTNWAYHWSWNPAKDSEDSDEGGQDRSPCQLVKRELLRMMVG